MNKLIAIVFAIIFVGYSTTASSRTDKENDMKILTIRWQRFVDKKGQTCERCGSTEKEVQKAFKNLKKSLATLGIKVVLKKKALDPATCAKDVSQSNRIWVAGRPLEEWLGAKVGKSPCGFCCAELGDDVECRTVEIKGQAYAVIPADLIIKAGLLAAAKMINVGPNEPCCGKETPTKIPSRGCCPKSDSDSKGCGCK